MKNFEDYVTIEEEEDKRIFSWPAESTFPDFDSDEMLKVFCSYEIEFEKLTSEEEKVKFISKLFTTAARLGFARGYNYFDDRAKEANFKAMKIPQVPTYDKSVSVIVIHVIDGTDIDFVKDYLHNRNSLFDSCVIDVDDEEIQLAIDGNKIPLEIQDDLPCAYEIKEDLEKMGVFARVYNFFVDRDSANEKIEIGFTVDGLEAGEWSF